MGMWYIKKMKKEEELTQNINLPRIFKKIVIKIKKIFSLLTIIEKDNKMIVIIPERDSEKISEKKLEKYAKKINNHMYDKTNQILVLENKLQSETFKNLLYANNCKILEGRWLFSFLLPKVLEYISEKQEIQSKNIEIAILINDNREKALKTIIQLAKEVRMINIVTCDIDKFRKLEEYLYETMGIVVRITNNRKKALLKSNIIFNYDFPEEMLNQYIIPKKAVVVSLPGKIKIYTKRFSGINANFYRVLLPEKYRIWFESNNIYNEFNEAILYESVLYQKNSYESIVKEIEENKSKILCLIGNNGEIQEQEYKFHNNFTQAHLTK